MRKALNKAINKQAIIDAVFQGVGTAAVAPLPPTSWGYNPNLVDDPYDPAAAKAELEAAGVTDLSMKIWAMPVQRPYNPNARRMAELLQADFAAVGVKAEIVSMEWGEYLAQSSAKDRDGAVLLGWTGDNADPDNFLGVLLGCDARRRQQPRAVVLPALRGPDPGGQDHLRAERAQAALLQGAGGLQGAGAVGDHRPLDHDDADAQDRHRLRAGSGRHPPLRRRRQGGIARSEWTAPPEAATLIGGRRWRRPSAGGRECCASSCIGCS